MASEGNIPAYFTSISDVLKTEPNFIAMDENLEFNDILDSQIRDLFSSASTLTAKQDLLKKFRQQLLLDCAAELKCSFILVADTATKLAANLLASVSLGGGSHLSSDVVSCFMKCFLPQSSNCTKCCHMHLNISIFHLLLNIIITIINLL